MAEHIVEAVATLLLLAAGLAAVLLWTGRPRQTVGQWQRAVAITRASSQGAPERTALYRYRSADGTLLYIGITNSLEMRDAQHRESSWWRSDAVTMDVEWYRSRAEALAAERRAIRAERPVANIQHSTRRWR